MSAAPLSPPAPLPTATPPPISVAGVDGLFPLSVERYHAMIAAGILTEDDPVELLEGLLVFKMPKNPSHETSIELVIELLRSALPKGWRVVVQRPITLPDGEPEPDVSVVRGRARDFADRHPGPGDVALVVEVADSSLPRDRGVKLRSYARAGVPCVWIVDLAGRRVEVYTQPDPHAKPEPRYTMMHTVAEGGSVSAQLDDHTLEAPVAAMLP